jgi:NRAMP (natural resistance-associated macrophage protein)-like metal ion transporter
MTEIRTWKSVVIWSIISAAFIGPGSVTTAVAAGSSFRLDLLWAVSFSTIACLVVQEVAARITIATGMSVGQTFALKVSKRRRNSMNWIIGGSVIAGCAAYEAGNILGAVSGLELLTGLNRVLLTIFVTLVSLGLLWKGSPQWIFNLMAILVAVMGVSFLFMALTQDFGVWELTKASVVPIVPAGSQLLILGLVALRLFHTIFFSAQGSARGKLFQLCV